MAACARVDGGGPWAEKLFQIHGELRIARGPRLAAYYAAFDALSKILADRSKFAIAHKDLYFVKTNYLYHAAMKVPVKTEGAGITNSGKGIVKTAKRSGKGVQVAFVPDKHKEMSYECTPTAQIISFRPDGAPNYYQNCKAAGMVTIDNTAKPIVVPAEWASGIAAGAVVEFDAEYKDSPSRVAIPKTVYSDKTKTKLVNYLGMSLE